ncbi:Protein asteroid-like protein 1-like [Oopsacas minuta]|uniref:Protein asteroid-like protein 1-like n=1 Tax=Oopsacas minuta TaxID=111878 RepID=A0AAV7K8S8_9METZ|nr:Protein asteroid-like protein 1-like [Oopsacas minuta]
MGIRGLSTYIHSDNACWTNINRIFESQSKDSCFKHRLIIDGSNLANYLHERNGLDSLFGGQYQELYEISTAFLQAVVQSGFHPIVVLEEIVEEEKKVTILARKTAKLRDLNRCVHNGESTTRFPSMGYIVLSEVVTYLNLETIFCDTEADPIISALAARLGASVLSNDSDFFLTKIPSVISLKTLSWDRGLLVGHFYNIDSFLQHNRLQYWAVPYIVILLGNDFIPEPFYYKLRKTITSHLSGDKIIRLFQLLNSFKDESAFRDCLQSHLSANEWKQFRFHHNRTYSSYLKPEDQVFIDPILSHYGLVYANIRKHSDYSFNALLRLPWTWGRFIRGEHFSQCSVQHYQRLPASECSLLIRSFINSILVRDRIIIEYVNTSSLCFEQKVIQAQKLLPDGNPIPNLDQISTIPQIDRLSIFLKITGSHGIEIEFLPEPWKMLAVTLRYWCLYCMPCPEPSLLKLIVSSCVITYQYPNRKPYHKLLTYKVNSLIRYNLRTFHQIAQWHNTYHDIYRLAQILDLPLSSPCLFYNGNLLFHILFVKEFRDTHFPELINTKSEEWINYLTRVIEG